MRWKAGSLLIGVALMFSGTMGMISRRADAHDEYRRSLELTSALIAARLDASIANAATTLSIAASQADLDRLTQALDLPVCAVADVVMCRQPPGTPRLTDAAGRIVDSTISSALDDVAALTASSARPVVVVATGGDEVAARAILVGVEQAARLLVAVMMLPDGTVVPASVVAHGDDDTRATTLDTQFGGERWWAQVTGEGAMALTTRERLAVAMQLATGALLVAGAALAVARDHRGLRRRATIDSLTGLPNRAEFERVASRALAQLDRDGRGACIIVIDLDRFKSINDTIGHAAGDRVLRAAATRLAGAVRTSDLVGRWGGDEFVLLLGGISDPLAVPERTAAIAACLREVPGAAGAGLTASVGAAVYPLDGRDLATLLDVADRAMYDAKGTSGAVHSESSAVPLRP